MEYALENGTLTLFLEGELNSNNASTVEARINEAIAGKRFDSLELDLAKLSYVSSAGLRILLKLKQKYGKVALTNASLEVYDVLQMTGFTNIMPVSKALRTIDISQAELIGEGYFSLVYRIDKDTIIKACRWVTDIQELQRELNLAKQAFVLGVPTAISFDVVRVNNGMLGIVFELLDNVSLRDKFRDDKDHYGELVKRYAALLKKINSTRVEGTELPDSKAEWLKKIDSIKPYLDEKDFQKARKMLEGIPDRDTFVHGDCHFKNIMVQGEDLFLIDMDTLSKGHPIFELAALYAPYIAFEEDSPGNNEAFLGVSKELSTRVYNDVLAEYFGKKDIAIFDKIKIVSYIHMIWWNRVNEPENHVRLEGCKGRLLELLGRYDDVLID